MKKSYLITGGCGFIGSHLAHALIAKGHRIRVVDNLSTGKREHLPTEAELIVDDICNPNVVLSALNNMDGCFHLAAVASVKQSEEQWVACNKINQMATLMVLEAIHRTAVSQKTAPLPLIFASSAAVYGNQVQNSLSENSPANPVNFYGADKLSSEQHAKIAFYNYHIPSIGLRFFNVYGTRQHKESHYAGVISLFMNNLLNNDPMTIFGDGEQSRDFIYVEDVVHSLISAMEHIDHSHDIFNVCTGMATTVNSIVGKLETLHHQPVIKKYQPLPPGDVRNSLGNPAKFKAMVADFPMTSFDVGLTRMYDDIVRAQH